MLGHMNRQKPLDAITKEKIEDCHKKKSKN
jgi:hypothetical protein